MHSSPCHFHISPSISSTATTNISKKIKLQPLKRDQQSTTLHLQQKETSPAKALSFLSLWLILSTFANRNHGIPGCDIFDTSTHFSSLWERASEAKYVGLLVAFLAFSTLKRGTAYDHCFSSSSFGMLGIHLSVDLSLLAFMENLGKAPYRT